MFKGIKVIKDKAASLALAAFKEKVVNPKLAGIGKVKEIVYRDQKLHLLLLLEGLEDHPIDVVCEKINIAPDGSSITIEQYSSTTPFAHNVLNQFATRAFAIPEGAARTAMIAAKAALGL